MSLQMGGGAQAYSLPAPPPKTQYNTFPVPQRVPAPTGTTSAYQQSSAPLPMPMVSLPTVPTVAPPPLPEVKHRSTTPPALTSEFLGTIGQRRSNAASTLKEILARYGKGGSERGRARDQAAIMRGRMREQFGTQRQAGLQDLGARGLSLQPRFAGQMLRQLMGQEQQGIGDVQLQLATQLQAYQQLVQESRQRYRTELANIAADKAREESRLASLI